MAQCLLMIRHGEKPTNGDSGVDAEGRATPSGLTPRGWQRAGALAVVLGPNSSTGHSALPRPAALVAPAYPEPAHRPYLTLLPLAQLLGRSIETRYAVDADPAQIAASLLASDAAVVLLCWEHRRLVDIAHAVAARGRVANADDIPRVWPDHRFDLVWRFDLDVATRAWTFVALDQRLLAGDQISDGPNHEPRPAE